MLQEEMEGQLTRLGGPSCLAGDIIGDYRVPGGATPGRRIAFLDQAHYSMVKTNTFNGVPLPSIWLWNPETDELQQRSEEHTSELQSLMRISYAVFCLKKKKQQHYKSKIH